jgi:DNA repair protein RadA/Sms
MTDRENKLGLVIVDSIQTLSSSDMNGMAGSVGQVRGCTSKLTEVAKSLHIPLILVGHVTKEGTVAGPMVLEHMVDTVLYLEGDSNHLFRILKTTKNRFGPVSEVGIFEMTETGMQEIDNPSMLFLGTGDSPSGSCVTVVMEGYRPILFEIQALTIKTTFGYPKRTASGYSINRLHVLIATIEKRCGLNLSDYDVYLSVSGGYKVSEYSCDLAVCLAIASSLKDKALKPHSVAFGECDLSGRVRRVPYQEMRAKEAKKLGYKIVLDPGNTNTLAQAISKAF